MLHAGWIHLVSHLRVAVQLGWGQGKTTNVEGLVGLKDAFLWWDVSLVEVMHLHWGVSPTH